MLQSSNNDFHSKEKYKVLHERLVVVFVALVMLAIFLKIVFF
jgi:hypothetical protein